MLWLNKKKKYPTSVPGYISILLSRMQTEFATFMNRKEKQYSIQQKKMLLLAFCLFIAAIQCFHLYKMSKGPQRNPQLPSDHKITTPQDIALPDSLDIEMIRQYRKMKKMQDSLSNN